MNNKLVIGQYLPLDSFIHRLDPRTKLLGAFAFVGIIFFADSWQSYALLSLFVLLGMMISSVPIRYFLRGIRPLLFLILFTTCLQLLFAPGQTILFKIGFIKVTEEGLIQAAFIFIRFLLIIFMSTLLTLTTMPLAIADGLESLMRPLAKIKVPVHEIALILSIALRFVPTLMEEADKIKDAQMARGATFGEGKLKDQMKAIVPLLIPLFINAIDRAEELATAMTARGYKDGQGRTKYREISYGRNDLYVLLAFIGLTGAVLWLS
ncbi:energy-coupling factor transporter transmembrane component T family protein [Allofustis seminis]|uniref:energy-coupling factor transporter transmembrane component T family protein n=1 Tax=Allofustis seminis TaxID=166939 RepID=UPI0003747008|nr:energy-coupling factor transporter transmembrane component T [Allofustis seminis]